jgi:hypothetical protein
MTRTVPLLMRPAMVHRFAVAVAGDRVVSMVGSLPYRVRAGPFRYRAAGLGIVATRPDHRGSGLATRLLRMQYARLWAEGVDLVIISGDRGLYDRSGAAEAGWWQELRLPAAPAPPSLEVRLLSPQDGLEMARLWAMEPVTIDRSPAFWRLALRAVAIQGVRRVVAVGRPAAAYAVLDVVAEEGQVRVRELAGSRRAALEAAQAMAHAEGLTEVRLRALPWDHALADAVRGAEWGQEGPRFGRYYLCDPQRTVRRLAPHLARLDPALDRPHLERVASEDPARATQVLFGKAGAEVSAALPIPLPVWEGLNFV